MMKSAILLLALALPTAVSYVFSGTLFQEAVAQRRWAPSVTPGVDIELPDLDELFGRIQQVSPLARQVVQGGRSASAKGFSSIDDSWPENLKWRTIEKNPRKTIHQIDKIDNFDGHNAPLLRFRSSLTGPCIGECFANFIMELEERKKWDPQIADVNEIYPVYDLEAANIAMGFGRYGDCSRLGVGYSQTKSAFGISPREQLTLCGIQDFSDNQSFLIWGTEMADRHNHLFPDGGVKHTRAKSHLFSTTLTPTSDTTFDVEYVLQLEVGLPTWLSTPILIDSIKSLFQRAESFYADDREGGELDKYLKAKAAQVQLGFEDDHLGLLLTP